ncbi:MULTISPECIES: helix-turn-helix domain-containing protein [unclassified Aminobacter]|uniref:helix-turn-helix domain-containing protein n=1 Tax=unclassified Aminobacter TaxID=2644704 RepID=UPI0004B58686|nr:MULTISPECIES: helix-turn-helix domain-containing protein [unclassified Aminobacter]TWH35897.1 PucR-like helix-turn-helix protein [Aminobacter sp. J15]
MGGVPVSTAELLETLAAFERHDGNYTKAGRELGISDNTVRRRLETARKQGLHLSDGAREAMAATRLNGYEIAGGYRHIYDDEGRKVETVRWNAPKSERQLDEYLGRIRAAFEDIPAAEPVPMPEAVEEDLLAFLPHADLHMGAVATEDQTGGRPYNPEVAAERFKAGVTECVMGMPPCAKAVIVDAGDATHANDDTDRTPRSGHKLKVEGTHFQNIGRLIELEVFKIDLALQRHREVEFYSIPGNHDPGTPAPVLYALQQRYRNEPRVTIHVSENEFWQMNWGIAFLCGHHGHNRKPKDVCAELPGKYPEQWGRARQWHYFSGHFHNYQSVPYGPVRHHQLPSVVSLDTHAAWGPYQDGAGMLAMTFHKRHGLKNMLLVGI